MRGTLPPKSPHCNGIVYFRVRAPSEPVEATKPLCRRHPGGTSLMVGEGVVVAVLRRDPQRLLVLLVHECEAYRQHYQRVARLRQ